MAKQVKGKHKHFVLRTTTSAVRGLTIYKRVNEANSMSNTETRTNTQPDTCLKPGQSQGQAVLHRCACPPLAHKRILRPPNESKRWSRRNNYPICISRSHFRCLYVVLRTGTPSRSFVRKRIRIVCAVVITLPVLRAVAFHKRVSTQKFLAVRNGCGTTGASRPEVNVERRVEVISITRRVVGVCGIETTVVLFWEPESPCAEDILRRFKSVGHKLVV